MKIFYAIVEEKWTLVVATDVRYFASGNICYTLLTPENEEMRMIAPLGEYRNVAS